MPTIVICCGFECGASQTGTHINTAGGGTIDTVTARTGARSLRINPSANTKTATVTTSNGSNTNVFRFYIRFSTLPSQDTLLAYYNSATSGAGLVYKNSDGKLYCGSSLSGVYGFGSSGVSILIGVWYRIDLKIDSSANPWAIDATVDGTALGQHSAAIAITSSNNLVLGNGLTNASYDAYFDDVAISQTSADYPLGAGHVDLYVPTSDGTHNIAGTGDFSKGTAGADILNSTTDAYTMVDDIPLATSITTTDLIAAIAPLNSTDYVECKFGPAPGVSAPSSAPLCVVAEIAFHQSGTQAGSMRVALIDNATLGDIINLVGFSGVTTLRWSSKVFTQAPSGVAWNLNGSGDGAFDNLGFRFSSADAAPDQYLDSILIEAGFADVEALPNWEWTNAPKNTLLRM